MNNNPTNVFSISERIILSGIVKSSHLGRTTVILMFLMLIALYSSAQYLETFSTPNKGYKISLADDFTGVNWSLSGWNTAAGERDASDYFQTTATGVLESIDLDQEVYWESPLINTSAAPSVSVKVDLSWVGFDSDAIANNCITDYIKVLYSVNGGGYVMVPNVVGGNACATISYSYADPGTSNNSSVTINHGGIPGGSNLKIRVVVYTNVNAEIVTIDNVGVPEAGVTVGCAPPVVSSSVTNVVCNGANSGKINITASAATPPYNISWTGTSSGNPAGNEIATSGGSYSITGLAAGPYTVTVTDAASCSQVINATVISAPIVQSAVTSPSSCSSPANGFIDLIASGWENPAEIGKTTHNTGKYTTVETGSIKITGGTPSYGKVLTSDNDGVASWVAPSATAVLLIMNEF